MSPPVELASTLVVAVHPSVASSDAQLAELTVHGLVPMLDALAERPDARVAWHFSGHLLDHLARHHEGFLLRLKELFLRGQVEVLGGPFYGGAPALLGEPDLRGQVSMASEFWESYLGEAPTGCLLPDFAWAAEAPRLMHDTGIAYGVLSDAQVLSQPGAAPTWGRLERGGLSLAALCVDAQLSGCFRAEAPAPFVERWLEGPERAVVLWGEALGPLADSPKETGLGRLLDALSEQQVALALPRGQAERTADAQPLVLVRDYAPWVAAAEAPEPSAARAPQALVAAGAVPAWAASHIGSWAEFPVRFAAVDTLYRRVLRASERLHRAIERMEDENLTDAWSGQLATAQRCIFRAQASEAFGAGRHGGFAVPAVRDAALGAIAAAEEKLDPLLDVSAGQLAVPEGDDDVFVATAEQTVWLSPRRGSVRSLEPKGRARNVLDAWTAEELLAGPMALAGGGLCDWFTDAQGHAAPLAYRVSGHRQQPAALPAEGLGEAYGLALEEGHGICKALGVPASGRGLSLSWSGSACAASGRYCLRLPLRLGPKASTLSVDGQTVHLDQGQVDGARRLDCAVEGASATVRLEGPWSVRWQQGAPAADGNSDGGIVFVLSLPAAELAQARVILAL